MTSGVAAASFGGQPIVAAISAITGFSEKGWDTSAFLGRANSYTSRIGEEYGTGWLLMLGRSLDELDTSAAHTLMFQVGWSAENRWTGLYIKSAVRLNPGDTQSPNTLYLVEIVDTKYYLRRKSTNKRYNCHALRDISDDYVTETLNAGTPWTWEEIIEDLWDENLSLIGAFPTLPDLSDITSVPENLRYEGVSAWSALNDICRRIGCTIVYDNVNLNKFYVVRLGAIDGESVCQFQDQGGTSLTRVGDPAIFEAFPTSRPVGGGDGLIWDEETLQGKSVIPQKVIVYFPTEFGDGQADYELTSSFGKWYGVEIDGSNSSSLPSGVACAFHDAPGDGKPIPRPSYNSNSEVLRYEMMTARFATPTSSTPSNQTALTQRAKEIARDIYRTLKYLSPCHVAYAGIKYDPVGGQRFIPGKCISSVTWSDIGQGYRTDIRRSLPILIPDIPILTPQPTGGGSSGGGGGVSAGDCACCGCLDCLDLCDQDAAKVVTGCDLCGSGAPFSYIFNPGRFDSVFSALGVYQKVSYVGDCTWESDDITVSGGTYKWVLNQADRLSGLSLVWVSGSDPLQISDGTRRMEWKAFSDREWSCLCNSAVRANARGERFPSGMSLSCEICLYPYPEVYEPVCELFQGCWNAGFSIGPIDVSACGSPDTPDDIVITLSSSSPDNLAGSQMYQGGQGWATGMCGENDLCMWSSYSELSAPVSSATLVDDSDYRAGVSICVGVDGYATAYFELFLGDSCVWSASYKTDAPAVIGSNHFEFLSSSVGDGLLLTCTCPGATWPASFDAEATSCSYGDLNPDVGYGCGGSGACDEGSCVYQVFDNEGTLQWGFAAGGSTQCGEGCGCYGNAAEDLDALLGTPAFEGQMATLSCVPGLT